MVFRTFVVGLILLAWPALAHAAKEQEIHYVGMSCAKVQGDSLVTPANEIFIVTHALQLNDGQTSSLSLPSSGYYKNVKAGFKTGGDTLVWRGRQQPVDFRVTMWEHDNGGASVQVFASWVTAAISARGTGSSPKSTQYGASRTMDVSRPKGGADDVSGPKTDPLTNFFATGWSQALGTDHDLVGYGRARLGKGDWAGEPLHTSPSGKLYHFATSHRRGGADCKAYFRFKRGAEYAEPVPPQPAPATPPAVAPPVSTSPVISDTGSAPGDLFQQAETMRMQCRIDYDTCYNQQAQCQSNFDQRYQSCARGLHDKLAECVRWHRERGRSPGACDMFRNTAAYCGDNRSNCTGTAQCQIGLNSCVSGVNRWQSLETSMAATFPPPSQPEPYQPLPPPEPQEPEFYLAEFENTCARPVSVAYHYLSPEQERVTAGWINVEPNTQFKFGVGTAIPEIEVYTNIGEVTGGNGETYRKVSTSGFNYKSGQAPQSGTISEVAFQTVSWRQGQWDKTIRIANCPDERSGETKTFAQMDQRARDAELLKRAEKANMDINGFRDLVDAGANVNARDASGATAFMLVAASGSPRQITQMIDHGADLSATDETGDTVFHYAIQRYYPPVLEALKQAGADINARNKAGRTPFEVARAADNVVVYQALMELGATFDPDYRYANGDSFLHRAVRNQGEARAMSLSRMILEAGANPNVTDAAGRTPITYAEAWQRTALIDLLVAHGATPSGGD